MHFTTSLVATQSRHASCPHIAETESKQVITSNDLLHLPIGSSLAYHFHTMLLFMHGSLKDAILPCLAFSMFGAFSGPVLGFEPQPSTDYVIKRSLCAALWIYIAVLLFNLNNQYSPESVAEDKINKPWRPIPARRITSAQTRRIFIMSCPMTLLLTLWLGGFLPLAGLIFLSVWYNDWGGSDHSGISRNFLCAAGYSCFFLGTLEAQLGRPYNVLNPNSMGWILTLGCVILTTIHAQDFRDEEGDKLRGRKTIQSAIGVPASQWTLIIAIMFWTFYIPLQLGMPFAWSLVSFCTGMHLVARLFQAYTRRNLDRDLLVYKSWCFWFCSVVMLPWIKLRLANIV